MRQLVLAALLATSFPSLPAFADEGMIGLKADQVGQIFCLSRLGNDDGPIEGMLSDGLEAAIADAQAKSDAWETANPGEKPPLGDGIPWQSWPDYMPKCTTAFVSLMKTDARVEIHYEDPGQPDAAFTDTLLLKKVDRPDYDTGVWRIDNIAYGTGGDLRGELASVMEGF